MLQDTEYHGQVIPGIKDEAGELSMRRNPGSMQNVSENGLEKPSRTLNEASSQSMDGESYTDAESSAAENRANTDRTQIFAQKYLHFTIIDHPNQNS